MPEFYPPTWLAATNRRPDAQALILHWLGEAFWRGFRAAGESGGAGGMYDELGPCRCGRSSRGALLKEGSAPADNPGAGFFPPAGGRQ